MQENENKDFNEAAEELKNIEVNGAEELEILEDTDNQNEMSEEELYAKYEEILARAKETGYKNRPYVKILNEEGDVANPISKDRPFLNPFPNRQERRRMRKLGRISKNNTQGRKVLVRKVGDDFLKYHVVEQKIAANTNVPIYEELSQEQIDEGNKPAIIGYKDTPAKVIQHYVLATKF